MCGCCSEPTVSLAVRFECVSCTVTCLCVCMCVQYAHTRTHTLTHVCARTQTYTHIHTHTHTHTHTRMHKGMRRMRWSRWSKRSCRLILIASIFLALKLWRCVYVYTCTYRYNYSCIRVAAMLCPANTFMWNIYTYIYAEYTFWIHHNSSNLIYIPHTRTHTQTHSPSLARSLLHT